MGLAEALQKVAVLADYLCLAKVNNNSVENHISTYQIRHQQERDIELRKADYNSRFDS